MGYYGKGGCSRTFHNLQARVSNCLRKKLWYFMSSNLLNTLEHQVFQLSSSHWCRKHRFSNANMIKSWRMPLRCNVQGHPVYWNRLHWVQYCSDQWWHKMTYHTEPEDKSSMALLQSMNDGSDSGWCMFQSPPKSKTEWDLFFSSEENKPGWIMGEWETNPWEMRLMGTGGRAGLVAVTPEKEINLIDFFTRAEKGRGNAQVRARNKDQESMDGHPNLQGNRLPRPLVHCCTRLYFRMMFHDQHREPKIN